MDEEVLYDSLDEEIYDEAYQSATQTPSPRSFRTKYDISSIIPLYGRETLKDNIKLPKTLRSKQKTKIPVATKSNKSDNKSTVSLKTSIISRTNKNVSLGAYDVAFDKLEKTYANIFYKRIGHPQGNVKTIPNDTQRSQWGDSTSRTESSYKSGLTHFSDTESAASDTTSFYMNLIRESENPPQSSMTKTLCSSTTCDFNLKSVSQYSVIESRKIDKKTLNLTVPKLGGLGADLLSNKDKMTQFKKRKYYGQKVSTQNRIKMMETKLLKELDKELKNSMINQTSQK